jgi:phage terminase large subunit
VSALESSRSVKIQVGYERGPNPKQHEFHTLNAKYRSFVGGWGNGKTSAGCVEFVTLLLEYPGTEGIVARKTRPELRATTWKMLLEGDTSPGGWKGIPKALIAEYNKSDLYVRLINGSYFHGLPLDDPKKIENFNLGLFLIDQCEEIEEDIFLKFHGRLRQHDSPREGIVLWNPNGHNWLWKRFIDPKRPAKWVRQYQCVEATTYDNPNLPDDYLDQFEGLPEHWFKRFILGSHEVFVGQIFVDYNPEVHVIAPFRIPSSWERWYCFDPGHRNEGAASWIARDFQGNSYYYREHLESGRDAEWWTSLTLEMEADSDFGGPDEDIFRRLMGPEGGQHRDTDGRSVHGIFGELGIHCEFADRDPVARISSVTAALRSHAGHRHPLTEESPSPRLFIFSTCDKLREYLPQYRWKPQRTNFTEEEPAEKPRKRDDHNIDNLGHILLAMDEAPEPDLREQDRQDPETRAADEHFDRALALAAERARQRGASRYYASTVT